MEIGELTSQKVLSDDESHRLVPTYTLETSATPGQSLNLPLLPRWSPLQITTSGHWYRLYPCPLHHMDLESARQRYNVFASVPRSSYLAERWDNGFQCLVGSSNPTIWRFIDVLKKEQDLTDWKISLFECRTPVQEAHCSSTKSNFKVCLTSVRVELQCFYHCMYMATKGAFESF